MLVIGVSTKREYNLSFCEPIIKIIIKEHKKTIILNNLNCLIKTMINNVDKLKRKNAVLSPDINIKTSIETNKTVSGD